MIDEQTRQWLLEADVAALEGRGGSELARRVREDPEVGAMARRLTAAMREADAEIASMASLATRDTADARRPAHDVQRTARGRNAHAERRPGRSRPTPSGPTSHRRPPVLATLGLAATAIAVILVSRPDPAPRPATGAAEPVPLTAGLEVSSSRPFAVFATDNPDIAIVWLFDEEEQ